VSARRARHLAVRFFGALRPGPPAAHDVEWVALILTPAEFELWSRQPEHDRRHSIAVARGVQRALDGTSYADDDRWLTCALLHDIGKLDSRLSVYGRVVATVSGAAGGHDMGDAWSERRGFTRRVGLYLRHPELGADRIRLVGGPEEAARWAAAHHLADRPADLGIPSIVVDALDAADND
jgi:putative nucleotidyltransferase with HDIG domain